MSKKTPKTLKPNKKRVRVSKKQNTYNKHYKTMLKSVIKSVQTAENKEDASAKVIIAQKVIDSLVTKGIIKKNNASNKKSRLMKFANKIA